MCVVTQPVRLLCATPGSVQAAAGLLLRAECAFSGCGLNKAQPITSWQIDGKTMKTMRDFILRAPKSLQVVTAAMKLEEKL